MLTLVCLLNPQVTMLRGSKLPLLKRQQIVGLKSAFEAYLMQWSFVSQSYTKVSGCIFTTACFVVLKITAFRAE